ncbi:MAG: class I SAM-dependent methyltransferase [Oscillospiraceae bacterium]
MNGYRALAPFYDAFCGGDYIKLRDFIDAALRNRVPNTIVLDAGCGTGTLAVALSKIGYDIIGVDASPEMLSIANEKAATQSADVLFLNQNLERLDLYGTVGAVICTRDTLNHVGNSKVLDAVLGRFSLFLEPSGILVFDINTEYKHREVLADNAFVYENENCFTVWQNAYDGANSRVSMTVDVFSKDKGEYLRSTDEFFEYTIDTDELERKLVRNGFEIKSKLDGDSYETPSASSCRLLYTAVKQRTDS